MRKKKILEKIPEASGSKILWLDCSSGISGDMLIGALISAGAPLKNLESRLLDGMRLKNKNVRISASEVTRMGIAATRFEVKEPRAQKNKNPFSWDSIKERVEAGTLSEGIRRQGLLIIKSIFDAEAKVHGMKSASEVHLHELGSADTIVDVFGALLCLEALGVEEVFSSPINLGGGTVKTRHGMLPVPAPATALLLKGVPVYGQPPGQPPGPDASFELTTPTGAAMIKGLVKDFNFGPMPPMKLEGVGLGAGSRDPGSFPNVLRAFVGEKVKTDGMKGLEVFSPDVDDGGIMVVETNIDDMNPQIYGYLMEQLFKAGALDVFYTPIIMKKNRPAVKITCLCAPGDTPRIREILFSETTTLGVRFYLVARQTLPRQTEVLPTEFGPMRFKVSLHGGRQKKLVPEYGDCLNAARKSGLPLIMVTERLLCAQPKRKNKSKSKKTKLR